jgi:hypothetical protein
MPARQWCASRLDKEVKVNLNLVGMKVTGARLIIAALFITTLISGLLVSIPTPANAAAPGKPAFSGANCETYYSVWSFTMTSTASVTGFKYAFTTHLEASAPSTFYDFAGTFTQNGNNFTIRFNSTDYIAAGKTSGQARPWIKGVSDSAISEVNNNSSLSCPVTLATPSAPTSMSASSSNSQCSINFNINDNGYAITNYSYSFDNSSYVEFNPARTTRPLIFTQDLYRAAGLSSNQSASIYIKGINAIGTGPFNSNSSVSCGTGNLTQSAGVASTAAPSGTTANGATLTSSVTFTGYPNPSKTYRWQRCSSSTDLTTCADISGATAESYVLTSADVSNFIRSIVIGTSGSTSATGTSSLTSEIIAAPPGIPGTPTVVAGDGEVTVTVVAPSSGGTPSSYLVTASPQVGGVTKTCTVSGASGSCTVTGLANGTAYTFTSTATNGAGTSSSSSASSSATPIAIPPTVTAVNSTTADGSYKVGDTISIQVTFSESVIVTGTPQLTLETGSTDRVLNYASGSGTSSLTFTYTVQSGDTSADLDYASTSALALNGGSINDSAGNTGVLTLPSLGASGSLSANKAIAIDTTLPTLTSFSSTTPDGAYKAGSTINITATLSEAVTAAASITVTLDNGKIVVLTHNALNNTLTGTYTVAAGDTSADLTVSSYVLTSAPTDAAGNIMTDVSVPSGANNLADTKAIVVDTTAPDTPSTPDLDSTSDSAGTSDSDNITSDNTPKINVSGSFSGTAVVTASKAGSGNVTCTISSDTCTLGTLADGIWSISVTDTDAAGNATTSAALAITVDATAPTPTVATVSVTTASGVTVRSSEPGTAYLVKSTVTVSNLTSITNAADDSVNQVTITAGATDTTMPTDGLVAGTYKLYVVDAAGNLSLASANLVTVAVAAAPTASATTAPTGTTTFGSTLTNAVSFVGVPTPTLSYQWKSCTNETDTATVCSDISGATSSSFIANAIDLVGKFIRVLVTAINGVLPDATAWSSPTAAITPVAPGVPVVGTPTLGDLQINVPVTAPASNGGSTILKYQFSTDGGATWRDRTDTATVSSPIVIKFLSTDGTTPIVAGTSYPVQIRAVNSASTPEGAGSASVSVTAATAPGAPTSVTATATGQTTATVSFTAPASNGGSAITSYTVTSSPGGITASGSSSPISVTGLSASTAYTFTVSATNAAATSLASSASTSVTTSAPPTSSSTPAPVPEPEPEPVCNAACVAAAAKAVADRVAADAKAAADRVAAEAKAAADRVAAEAKAAADRVAAEAKAVSDTAAKVVAEKVTVDKTVAEVAAKAAVDKATAAAVAKAASDAAAVQAALVAKAAADAQAAAVEAASKAAEVLKSATTTAAAKAAATAAATKAATTAAKAVKEAAGAAKAAATAKNTASNASKQVDIAIGALSSQTASASSAAQANAIAAAAKAAANAAAKSAADQAAAAKAASNNANKEATDAAARIVTEQREAAEAAAVAKAAADADLKANELKIATATESQKAMEAVVAALNEKVALADASVKAATVAERAEIDKKMADMSTKIAELQKVADELQVAADAAVAAQVITQASAKAATENAAVLASEAAAAKLESEAKTAAATEAAASASLAKKVASAAKAAAAKVPAKAVISSKPSASAKKNSTKATISGLKPGQKVKVTVNVKNK